MVFVYERFPYMCQEDSGEYQDTENTKAQPLIKVFAMRVVVWNRIRINEGIKKVMLMQHTR